MKRNCQVREGIWQKSGLPNPEKAGSRLLGKVTCGAPISGLCRAFRGSLRFLSVFISFRRGGLLMTNLGPRGPEPRERCCSLCRKAACGHWGFYSRLSSSDPSHCLLISPKSRTEFGASAARLLGFGKEDWAPNPPGALDISDPKQPK